MRTMKTAVLTLAGVLLAFPLFAQTPRGTEIKVNNLQASSYWAPQVAAAPNGGFVVVWQTGYLGDPPVEKPVVWVRLFRADGTPKTNQLRVNPGSSPQVFPKVAVGADGSFVVVWEDILPTGGTVSGRRFDAEGRPRGRRFRLNSTPVGFYFEPAVALAADGSFVAAWTGDGVTARRFDAAGQPLGPEFRVNTTTFDERETPQVAMNASGAFVIGWIAYNGEGSFFDIMARPFAADGTPQSDEIQVNSGENTRASQDQFALGVAQDGSFVALWTDQVELIPPFPNGFFGQRFTPGGEPLGAPFRINSSAQTVQREPAIAVAADGSFFAVWSSYVSGTTGPVSIVGRRFASDGTPRGGDLRIDRSATPKGGPSVALGGDGRGLVVWIQDDGIVARRLAP